MLFASVYCLLAQFHKRFAFEARWRKTRLLISAPVYLWPLAYYRTLFYTPDGLITAWILVLELDSVEFGYREYQSNVITI